MKTKLLLWCGLLLCLLPLLAGAADPKKKAKQPAGDERALVVGLKGGASGRRVALVIGNGAYRHSDSMPVLANPANDADDMAAALQRFGFEVIAKKNLTREEMDEAISDFGRRAADSDAALFYYAGHGLQVKGQNYLVPVDASIDSEARVPYRTVNVNQLLEEMDNSRSRVNIVMLDACRNNPISGKFRSGATRGLAPPAATPKGTVIVYATDPGNTAADGSGRNGLFTAGLLAAFKGNDLSLGGVLTRASEEVESASNRRQTPYVNGPETVKKRFSFVQPSDMTDLKPSETRPQPLAAPAPPPDLEGEAWNIVKDSGSIDLLKDFLNEYPNGAYAKLARIKLKELENRSRPPAAAAPTATAPRAFSDPATGMEFVPVPAGCFQMGDTFGGGDSDEQPVHEVCLGGFAMGKYEVTQGQWRAVMGGNPSHFSSCGDNCPVEQVSWNDVQEFIRALNRQSGKNYRLPSEAEWEYAARSGGRQEKYSGGDDVDAVAWYSGNSGSKTHPVGQKQANGLGLHDMSGNVWEWVSDWKGEYPSTRQQDPTGPSAGTSRVLRGGSCYRLPADVRASYRFNYPPGYRDINLGFRLVSPVQ